MESIWLVPLFVVLGLITFLQRFSFIALFGRRAMPPWLARFLRFVPPAVLCAIIFPDVLLNNGILAINADNHRLLAALLAVAVAMCTRNLFLTITVGMVTLWLITFLTQ